MALLVDDPDAAIRLLEAEGETVSRIGVIGALGDGPARALIDPPSGWLA